LLLANEITGMDVMTARYGAFLQTSTNISRCQLMCLDFKCCHVIAHHITAFCIGDREPRFEYRPYAAAIEPARDVYDVTPLRPASAPGRLRMPQCLRAACGAPDVGP
jgi:hypothetical protein